jgi:ribosomal protein L40E
MEPGDYLIFVAILLLLFNVAMSAWVLRIAEDKGLEGAWGLYGFLAWPIALGFALAAPSNPVMLEREGLHAGTLRKCPACLAVVPFEAKKCRYCAELLPPIEKKPRSAFKRHSAS